MSQVETNSHSDELESRIAGLEQLLSALERTVVEQSERLERASRAESHLAAIVQSADDAIVTISPDLRVMSWNQGAERLIGFTCEEALGQRATELYLPSEAREWVEREIREDFATLEQNRSFVRRMESALQRKDGSLVDVSLVATGVFNSERSPLGMSIIFRDISERRQAESEQALLASIVSSTDDAVISISPELKITTWNRGAEKLLGFTAAEAIGRPVTIFNPAEPQTRVERRSADLLARARDHRLGVERLELVLRKKDGMLFDASLVIAGIYDPQGELTGLSGIITDISERKRAEREQGLLASIVQSSDDGIISVGLDAGISSWNAAAEKLFGFNPEEAIGRNLVDLLVPPELRERAKAGIKREFTSAAGGHPLAVLHPEVPALRKDGSTVEVAVSVSGIYDSAGNLLGASSIVRDVTERKRAEREQALLASIVESSDDAIFSLSSIGPLFPVMSWNRGAEKLFGFTAEEAIGRNVTELYVVPELREHALSLMKEDAVALKEHPEQVRHLEVPAVRKDGSQIDIAMVVSGIYDGAGNLLGISNIVRDVTERKRAEREQRMLAAIVNASEDAIISTTLDNSILSWNRGAEKLFGISAAESIGRMILEFVPSEEHVRMGDAVAELLECGKPVNLRLNSKRKDGTLFDSWVNLFPTYDASGNISAVGAIGRDITEMVRLEHQQTLLATIVNASADAILSTSREDRVTSWNPAAEKLYGLSAKETIGRGIESFLSPEEASLAKAATKRIFETGEPLAWEQRVPQKDGTIVISMASLFPIRDSEGTVVEVAGIGHDITRLKRIEAELREAHEYTRGLIESSVDAMVIVDPDMRISDGNERLAQLTELPKKSLFGSAFDSHFTEPAKARAAIEKALADGYITNVDLTLKAASGKQIPISFNASLFYRAGKVFGIFGVARDVTEQRAMERTLRAEREYSRSLVQSSPDALLVSDSTLTLTDVNEQALKLTSYAREELIGSRLPSLFTDPIRATEVIEKVRQEGLARDIELLLLSRSAREIPVSLNVSAFEGGDGPGRRIVAAVRDISETKRAQEANSLLASIVGASGDAIYSETTDMMITSWNPAAEKRFGYSAAEMVGRSAVLMTPLDGRGELAQRIRRIDLSRKPERYETVRLRKDGSPVEVAVTHSPILDASGAMTALSVVVADISERKRMEAELTEARDAALEGARIKSEFLANMSHEIRTPLNSIIGMTGLLLDSQLTEDQRDLARDVQESGDVLLNLINDILDFSKIAAGKLSFEEVDFNLTDAVEGAIQLISEQARRKGLELNLSVEPEVPQLLCGDATRLRQILLNLLSNAVKFTERGEVALEVSKLGENPREVVVRFEVRDTGIGIAKEKQNLLFQTFSQVDASTSRRYGGTGLGLSIAKKLVEGMHGTIAVTSKPGVGSTFWFTAQFAKQVDEKRPASERFASLSGHKVLIVDDNATSRHILERQTAAWGMLPKSAPSAEEALALMRRNTYEVALLDVMMPEVDGIELARRIKASPPLAKTALIFVSSTGPRIEFNARLSGLDYGSWLMKPVPESLLYDALVKAIASVSGETVQAESEPQERAGAKEPPAGGKLKLPSRKLKVLLAEDNPINQKLAKLQLTKLGFEVDAVANGREALEAVSQHPYDVIFMDCQMPEMDGYEATREIRQRERQGSRTTIVAMTAHAMPGDREKCLAAGMDGYISKPVKLEALEATLEELFESKPPAPENTAAGE